MIQSKNKQEDKTTTKPDEKQSNKRRTGRPTSSMKDFIIAQRKQNRGKRGVVTIDGKELKPRTA